jgi:hypothetical protein
MAEKPTLVVQAREVPEGNEGKHTKTNWLNRLMYIGLGVSIFVLIIGSILSCILNDLPSIYSLSLISEFSKRTLDCSIIFSMLFLASLSIWITDEDKIKSLLLKNSTVPSST